eukprot:TRINITY_DN9062_c0_g1::TRINITY_DN9062_c0_g1_i1::g.18178::m.18178 TRINITY_DN9062_c0_g1::TRINITY_DN9062_c0_g1_i1::g.18178  ORF type:complete len:164 (+),score=20.65,sp/Q693B1/KCD11_HUMAN/31.34/1e-08,BTB_2/PF02214.17/3.8e-10,PRY/PF13765.1/0.14 TRINITY_DN9062_c0_g1_i1:151-642(+)
MQAGQGPFFIDRDPKYFKLIINYLRTDILDISRLYATEVDLLKRELDYYQLQVGHSSYYPPPQLEWDPAFKHSDLKLSSDRTKVTHKYDSSSDETHHRVMCSTAGVTTFSVSVVYSDAEKMKASNFKIGFTKKSAFSAFGNMDPTLCWGILGVEGKSVKPENV